MNKYYVLLFYIREADEAVAPSVKHIEFVLSFRHEHVFAELQHHKHEFKRFIQQVELLFEVPGEDKQLPSPAQFFVKYLYHHLDIYKLFGFLAFSPRITCRTALSVFAKNFRKVCGDLAKLNARGE
jgi:hypothetical protein